MSRFMQCLILCTHVLNTHRKKLYTESVLHGSQFSEHTHTHSTSYSYLCLPWILVQVAGLWRRDKFVRLPAIFPNMPLLHTVCSDETAYDDPLPTGSVAIPFGCVSKWEASVHDIIPPIAT